MAESYAFHEGAFGQAIVLELRADLVEHAHSETQIAFWLGGARAEARIGSEVVKYSEHIALGANAYQSHDVTLLDDSGPCAFLAFMISKQWLEERSKTKGRSFLFPSPQVPIDSALRQSCWRVLDLIISAHEPRASVDDAVERLLGAAIDSSMSPAQIGDARFVFPRCDRRLRAAISYMREHVEEKTSVDEIAGKVGLSRAHFFALFRDQLNTTPQGILECRPGGRSHASFDRRRGAADFSSLRFGFFGSGKLFAFLQGAYVSPSTFRRAAGKTLLAPVTGLPR